MFSLLRNRNFALVWVGGLVSMAGNWMLFIALPLHVYELSGSTLATSLMFMSSAVPRIVLGSIAGVFVDRWERKRTMVITNLLLALSILPLLLVRSTDMLWLVYLVSFIQATLGQFFGPAENAFLPTLVGEEKLLTANALNSFNNDLARLIGPVLGGFVTGLVGIAGVALFDAVTYLIAALLIALVTVTSQPNKEREITNTPRAALSAVWSEWREGLGIIRNHRTISILFTIMAITAVGEGIMSVLFVVFVNESLGGGALEMGWIMSGQAVGGLLGGLILSGWIGRLPLSPMRLLGWSSVLFGFIDLLIFNSPRLYPSVLLVVVLIALVGFPAIALSTSLNTLLQTSVSDAYRGRVFGAQAAILSLLMLAGMALAGTMGDRVGAIPMLNIQGFGYVVAGFLGLLLLRPVTLLASRPSEVVAE